MVAGVKAREPGADGGHAEDLGCCKRSGGSMEVGLGLKRDQSGKEGDMGRPARRRQPLPTIKVGQRRGLRRKRDKTETIKRTPSYSIPKTPAPWRSRTDASLDMGQWLTDGDHSLRHTH